MRLSGEYRGRTEVHLPLDGEDVEEAVPGKPSCPVICECLKLKLYAVRISHSQGWQHDASYYWICPSARGLYPKRTRLTFTAYAQRSLRRQDNTASRLSLLSCSSDRRH